MINSQSATITVHHTRVDTIQSSVNKLQHTIDSLTSQLHDFGIASTYYHDILNSDVAIFIGLLAIIVTIAGFISWGVIRQTMLSIKRDLLAQLHAQDERFKQFNTIFDEKIKDFDNRDAKHTYDTSRLLYFSNYDVSQFVSALTFGLKTLLYCFKSGQKSHHINAWKENVGEALDQVSSKEDLMDELTTIEKQLMGLKELNDTEVDTLIEKVKIKIYKIIYG